MKKQVNFSLPVPIGELFEEMAKAVTEKQKWLVISGALLSFAEHPPEARKRYYGDVSYADATDTFETLVRSALKRSDQATKDAPLDDIRPVTPDPKPKKGTPRRVHHPADREKN